MKLDKLNAWLGLLGNVAVLGGLIAVAVEIRGNNQAMRLQELQSFQQIDSGRQLAMLDPDSRSAYAKALFEPSNLTMDELYGASMYLNYRLSIVRGHYRSYNQGFLTQADWLDLAGEVPIFLGSQFGKSWWEYTKRDYEAVGDGAFVESIDAILRDTEVVPDDSYYLGLCEAMELSECRSR